jgi:uncharacterized LabA/DUF88 family protein
MRSERVIAYIDGFNLYFGLKEKGWRCYYWLDIQKLCRKLLLPKQHLVIVKYFTSRIKKASPAKHKRQSIYIEALQTLPDVKMYYGKYQLTSYKCKNCAFIDKIPEEKMTDVQLGVEVISDAYQDKYDTAFIITGDIDIVPSVEKVRAEFSSKRVIIVFPPMRATDELRTAASGYLHIKENLLKESQLPDEIVKTGAYALKRPIEWT